MQKQKTDITLTHLMNEADAFAWDAYRDIDGDMPIANVVFASDQDRENGRFHVATYPIIEDLTFNVRVAHTIALAMKASILVFMVQATAAQYDTSKIKPGTVELMLELYQQGRLSREEIERELGGVTSERSLLIVVGEDATTRDRQMRTYELSEDPEHPGHRKMIPLELLPTDISTNIFPLIDFGPEQVARCHDLIHSPEFASLPIRVHADLDPSLRKEPLLLPLDR